MTSLPAAGFRAVPAKTGRAALAAAALATVVAAGFAFTGGAPPASGPVSSATVLERYGKLPLRFEVNRGQTAAGVDYIARGAGSSLALSADRARLTLPADTARARADVVQMQVVGADPRVQPRAGRRLAGVSNYLTGSDPRRWRTGVPGYASVTTYPSVYPGIDVVYHGRQAALEYDFVVAPRTDPSAITLRFSGVESMRIDRRGDLLLYTRTGIVRQHAPVAYQRAAGGERVPVDARYARRADGRIGFALGGYDRDRRLVIDPILSYLTYLGTVNTENANAVAVDAAGSAYVTGTTNATGTTPFPTTAGAFQTGYAGGNNDAFVTKLSPSGTQLEYSTYIGGNGADQARAIAVEGTNAYITGDTTSAAPTSFPTTAGALQTARAGTVTDAFVTKLSATGAALE